MIRKLLRWWWAPITFALAAAVFAPRLVAQPNLATPPFVIADPLGQFWPLAAVGNPTTGYSISVSLSPSGGGSLTYKAPDTYSVATTTGSLFAAGFYPAQVQLCLPSNAIYDVWLNTHGGAAVVGSGIPVRAGACAFFGPGGLAIPAAATNAISDGPSPQTLGAAGG